jgi:bifunctional DNA-binding transcriptional regulator/antitoxin component of YhaV-PrlF toxin-antitoxin module
MNKQLVTKLGIKAGDTVCLIRPNKKALVIVQAEGKELKTSVDRLKKDCDVILYGSTRRRTSGGKWLNCSHLSSLTVESG